MLKLRQINQTHHPYGLYILLLPSLVWLVLFFIIPVSMVLLSSLAERGTHGGIVWKLTVHNYAALTKFLYGRIFLNSALIALLTTGVCLVLSYPLAYYLARYQLRWRNALLLLLVVPFWTNFLVRTYAWKFILRTGGVIDSLFQAIGLPGPDLLYNHIQLSVLIGLVYGYLPFMVLPLYASLEKMDPALLEAAQDLGATPWAAFWRVIFPLSLPGVISGSILVFIPSLGAYITPDLFGGGKYLMIGNLIGQQFSGSLNWPFGSALSFVLMVIVLAGAVTYFRLMGTDEI